MLFFSRFCDIDQLRAASAGVRGFAAPCVERVPAPGVPESFKVLVKELQSLCLDVRVLDKDGSEIELKEDDDDDYIPGIRDEYRSSEEEFTGAGYEIDRSQAVMDTEPEDDYFDDEDENMGEDE